LKEAYRLLRPEGKVIITMIPDKVGVLWHAIFERFWGESKKGRTFNEGEKGGIDAQEVILLLNQAGFRIEKKSKFMFGINNIIIGRK
jgi:ubiquinone/menaquinone biosynthesis C-methylase UbiE